MATNNIIARAPPSPNDIDLYLPDTPTPQVQYDLVLSNADTPNDITVREPGTGNGSADRGVVLSGFRLTTYSPSLPVEIPLTGFRATAQQGKLVQSFLYDTFTGSNGTAIQSHTPEAGGAYTTLWSGTGTFVDCVIQGNRLRGKSGPDWVSSFVPAVSSEPRYMVEGRFRAVLASNTTDLGIYIGLYYGGSGPTGLGYFVGYNPTTSTFDVSYWSGSVLSVITSTSDPLSATDERLVRLEISNDSTGSFTLLRLFVNDVFVTEITDGNLVAPTWSDFYTGILNFGTTGDSYCDIDFIRSGPIQNVIDVSNGIDATAYTAQGVLTPSIGGGSSFPLTGLAITTAYGTLTPGIGGNRALTGLAATTAQGSLTPFVGFSGDLVGNAATTAQGAFVKAVTVGVYDGNAISPLRPKTEATIVTYGNQEWYRPPTLVYQLANTGGDIATGSGTEYLPLFVADGTRIGDINVNQRTKSWFQLDGSTSTDEIYADNTLRQWPRNGYPSFYPALKYYNSYNTTYSIPDAQGHIHTGTVRERFSNDPTEYQFGWQNTGIALSSPNAGRYLGPELNENVLSFYPIAYDRIMVVHQSFAYKIGSDIYQPLTARRAQTDAGTVGTTNVSVGGSVTLTGRGCTVLGGTLARLGTESGCVVERALVVTGVSFDGSQNDWRARTQAGTLLPINSSYTTRLLFRYYNSGELDYNREPVFFDTATGDVEYFRPGPQVLFVQSGNPDIVFIAFATGVTVGTNPLNGDPVNEIYAGLAVYNLRTRVFLRSVQKKVTYSGIAPMLKAVPDVIRKEDGTYFSQFIYGGVIYHLSWKHQTYTATDADIIVYPPSTVGSVPTHKTTLPVVTFKDPPPTTVDIGPWGQVDAIETRAELGYHVLYSQQFRIDIGGGSYSLLGNDRVNISKLYANDITLPTSDWTVISATASGGETVYPEGHVMNRRFGGTFPLSGGGLPSSYLHSGDYLSAPFGPGSSSAVIWDTFWDQQNKIFSVAAQGSVGSVSISITPNVQLTGQRATFTQGAFSGIVAGNDRTITPTGRKATGRVGLIAPPSITFLIDTFSVDPDGTALASHTGELASWVDPLSKYKLSGGAATTVSPGIFGRAYALNQPDRRDYRVSFTMSMSGGGSHNGYDGPEVAVGVRCTDAFGGIDGYFFGMHPAYGRIQLYKTNSHGDNPDLWSGSLSGTAAPYTIEVNGVNPTRITLSDANGVLAIIDDYGTQFYDIGNVCLFMTGVGGPAGFIDNINGKYYDPEAFPIDGLRATTAQGVMTGPWPVGQRATTAIGVLQRGIDLTGLAATTAQGTIFPVQGEVNLVGQVATATAGTITAYIPLGYIGLLGIQLQTNSGVLGMGQSLLPGQVATCTAGQLGVVVDAYPALTGLAATTASVTLTPEVGATVLGRNTTTAPGLLVPGIVIDWFFTGHRATLAQGVMGQVDDNFSALVGQHANTAGGLLTPVTTEGSSLGGQQAVASGGVLKPQIDVAMTGLVTQTRQGTLSVVVTVGLTGGHSNAAQGLLAKYIDKSLSGLRANTASGIVGQTHSCVIFATGVEAQCFVGDVTRTFGVVTEGMMLWARTEVEKLFVLSEPDSSNPIVEPND